MQFCYTCMCLSQNKNWLNGKNLRANKNIFDLIIMGNIEASTCTFTCEYIDK